MSLDVYLKLPSGRIVYEANITHNLNTMAAQAGLYEPLWRPEEVEATHARDLTKPIGAGLHRLLSEREFFEGFNPENGWGNYDHLVAFAAEYLDACNDFPEALIEVSR